MPCCLSRSLKVIWLPPAGRADAGEVRVARAADAAGLAVGQGPGDHRPVRIAVDEADHHLGARQERKGHARILPRLRPGHADPAGGLAAAPARQVEGKDELVAAVFIHFGPLVARAVHKGADDAGNFGLGRGPLRSVGHVRGDAGKAVAVEVMLRRVRADVQGDAQTQGDVGLLGPLVGDLRDQVFAVEGGAVVVFQGEDQSGPQSGDRARAGEDLSPADQLLGPDLGQALRLVLAFRVLARQIHVAHAVR